MVRMQPNRTFSVVSRAFTPRDLVAGHPAFDLVNTVTAWNTPTPRDWFDGYARVLEWARLGALLEGKCLERLARAAQESPPAAAKALARLKELRFALHEIFSDVLAHKRPPADALAALDRAWHAAQQRTRVEHAGGRVVAQLAFERSGLDLPRDTLAAAAVELLQRLPQDRARICRGEQCGWLFFDSSKGGHRVWCDMATCGNAAKTRRHQHKPPAGARTRRP